MSLYQAMCLLLFNNNNNTTGRKGDKSSSDLSPPSLTYNEILAQTNIPPAELYTTLQSLALAKVSPLKMTPRSKEINRDTSKFTVNTEFKHPLYRIKLNTILMKETAGEGDKCREKVFEDRKSMIDCHVVRILKMRKRMEHRELVGEVFKMARFPIKVTME